MPVDMTSFPDKNQAANPAIPAQPGIAGSGFTLPLSILEAFVERRAGRLGLHVCKASNGLYAVALSASNEVGRNAEGIGSGLTFDQLVGFLDEYAPPKREVT